MRNDEAKGKNGGNRGRGVFSTRSLSSYMRFVSSGASTIRSAGASIVSSIANANSNAADASTRDQVPTPPYFYITLELD